VACVPAGEDPGLPPPVVQACAINEFYVGGQLALAQRFDAEGHLLEKRHLYVDGSFGFSTTHRWQAGLEVYRLEVQRSGPKTETEWHYTAQGRLERWLRRHPGVPGEQTQLYVYGSEERLERVDLFHDSTFIGSTSHTYDAEGRLTLVVGDNLRESRLYHPNGHLRRRESSRFMWDEFEDYDAEGRRTSFMWCNHSGCHDTDSTYGPGGQLVRTDSASTTGTYSARSVSTWRYDAQGRVSVLWRASNVRSFLASGAERDGRTRETLRYTYACGSGLLLLEERDSDEDGVPDGWHTYERDASGRLLRERYSGSFLGPWATEIREYQYDCQ
jgi:hypothetical protein